MSKIECSPGDNECSFGEVRGAQKGATTRQERIDCSYRFGDIESLVKNHSDAMIDLDMTPEHGEDSPGISGEYVKSFVLGGLDGIVSTFALVSGLGGANVAVGKMIAVCFAKVLADAFSMGFGEFTSASAELEQATRLKKREEWETENFLEGEVKEMCHIYEQKGCAKQDALTLMTLMAKYKDLFVEHMMVMEHGVMLPEEGDKWAAVKQGLTCFLAFFAFSQIPLLGVIALCILHGSAASSSGLFLGISYALTAFTLFLMGLVKARLVGAASHFKSGALMVINGTVAGGVAYVIGEILAASF